MWSVLISWLRIPIRIHPLLWFLLAGSVVTGYILELIVLFVVVIIHELGHVAAASSFRWRVREIRLLPFGGVAEVEEAGDVPAWQELIVVLAGPLQNLLMIGAALLCQSIGIWSDDWASYFVVVNMMIGLFNLLPILPLDGGRLLQILLSTMLPYYRTLHLSYSVSLLFSSLLIAVSLGLWNRHSIDLNLLMMGIFLFSVNWSDYRNISYIFIRFLMGKELRAGGMLTAGIVARPIVSAAGTTLPEVVKLLMRGHYHIIYVCDEFGKIKMALPEQLVIKAYLDRSQLVRAMTSHMSYNKKSRLSERRT